MLPSQRTHRRRVFATTWNPSDTSALNQFSNGGLKLTRITTNNAYAQTRSISKHTTGKYYFEIKPTVSGGGLQVGFATSTLALDSAGEYLGQQNYHVGVATGNTYYNNASIGASAAFVSGTVIGLAIDLVNSKIWSRVGTGGWNNDVIANQNPAANTGGFSFAGITAGPYYAVAQTYRTSDHVIVANFGATAYANPAPSGFADW